MLTLGSAMKNSFFGLVIRLWFWIRRSSRDVALQENINRILAPPPLDLGIYDAFRKYVQHEDDLVNQRISWMLVIHGFLYAAYAFTVQKKFDIAEKIYKATVEPLPTEQIPAYLREAKLQTVFVLMLIAIIGFVISLMALCSIVAAKNAAESVQTVFQGQFRVQAAYKIPETVTTKRT